MVKEISKHEGIKDRTLPLLRTALFLPGALLTVTGCMGQIYAAQYIHICR